MKTHNNIMESIPIGRENAMHLEEISEKLNMNPNSVKKQIREARENGMLILSSKCGYWYSEDVNERATFVDRIEKNARARLKTIKAIKRSLKTIKGQGELEIGGEK